ncbi:MAG: YciI family protein [Tropicimonas sp.]|uniref:YciI family protein n=1 Tax=Tropicimonas sp. TaxID=2067044 RepID=UPI003A8417C0
MPKFVFAYHGGKKPATKEEGAAAMAAWTQWFEELGPAVLNAGSPVGQSWTVSSGSVVETGGANPISGYSVIQAPDMVTAVKYAKGCPLVKAGGSVEVAEALPF